MPCLMPSMFPQGNLVCDWGTHLFRIRNSHGCCCADSHAALVIVMHWLAALWWSAFMAPPFSARALLVEIARCATCDTSPCDKT